jgi:hypothetical protein
MTTLLDTEIARLARRASKVITQHTNHHGVCAACGSDFPCDRAVLAEHNLALCGYPLLASGATAPEKGIAVRCPNNQRRKFGQTQPGPD